MKNPFSLLPKRNSSSPKIIVQDTDPYCDLSITYTNDFPGADNFMISSIGPCLSPLYSESAIERARRSIINIRSDSQLRIEPSPKQLTTRRKHKSNISLTDTLPRSSDSALDQMNILIQSMHETMKSISSKLEQVDQKTTQHDEESKELKDSIIELKDKIEDIELRIEPKECSKMCEII
ncbi:hypothetical protein SteCoe_37164 [Stentor coeruleus]|uniref:Uncharacterized protein n=1 Tax=Stentor coeruleus TaxID=5963 RepID=A0A1R2ANL4_9CILI|nr:hypothetical protein SteCoe_37164 [Stentor coeruleus]